MPQVDPVILKLESDLADYHRGMLQAERLSDQRFGAIQRSADRMGTGINKAFSLAKTAAVAFIAAHGIAAIKNLITTGLEYAGSLAEIAAQAGVTTTALQEYVYAGGQAGLSQEQVVQGLEQLNRRLGDAALNSGTAGRALERLGVNLRDANGEVKNAAEIIPEIAEAMKGVSSESEKASLRQELFGRSGQRMAALLSEGASGVDNLREAAHRLGIVLSSEQIARADETADKLDAVKTVLSARIAGVVADNANAVLALASAFERLVIAAGNAVSAYTTFKLKQGEIEARANAFAYGLSPLPADQRRAAQFEQQRRAYSRRLSYERGQRATTIGSSMFGVPQVAIGSRGGSEPGAPGIAGGYDYNPGAGGGGGGSAGAAAGPSAQDLARAMRESTIELESLAAEYDRAQAELTSNIHARAIAEKAALDADLARDIERLQNDDELSEGRRAELIAAQRRLASVNRELIEQEEHAALARESADALEKELGFRRDQERQRSEMADIEIDAVEAETQFADTLQRRNRLERHLLGLQQEEERARLEAAIAMGEVADAAAARAALSRRQEAEQRGLERDQEGPGKRYLRELRDEAENLGRAYEEVAVDGLQRIEDALARTAKNALGLHGVLGDIVGDLIQIGIRRQIIGPLADALFGGGSGGSGGGAIGRLLGGLLGRGGPTNLLPGRASGGYVGAGQLVRVNEGAGYGRSEGWMPAGSGKVIPLGQMEAMRSSGGSGMSVVRIEVLEGQMFEPKVQVISGQVSAQVIKLAQPSLTQAAVAETFRQASRPGL